MTTISRKWRIAAALYVFINAGGAIFAVAQGEGMHAAVHIALLLVGFGGWFAWRAAGRAEPENLIGDEKSNQHLDHLQESLDTIALEVERIGESQRYARKILEQRAANPPTEDK